jgi:hypothetical protein
LRLENDAQERACALTVGLQTVVGSCGAMILDLIHVAWPVALAIGCSLMMFSGAILELAREDRLSK